MIKQDALGAFLGILLFLMFVVLVGGIGVSIGMNEKEHDMTTIECPTCKGVGWITKPGAPCPE